jgi:hypothetical protein
MEISMPDKKTRKIVVPASKGMTRDFVDRLKLILKLISPIDIIMGIPGLAALDDAAILWIGSNLFIELCPPAVVQEHMQEIDSNLADSSGDIVDADATDINDK